MDRSRPRYVAAAEAPPGIADADGAACGIAPVAAIYPASAYRRPLTLATPPGPAADALADALARHRDAAAPASFLVELRDVDLVGNVVYLRRSDAVLWETHRPCDREALTLRSDAERAHRRAVHVAPDTDLFWLGSAGSFNYGHWLVDDLPRAKAILDHRARHPAARVAVLLPSYGYGINRVRRDTLRALLGATVRILFADPGTPLAIARLLYPTPVSIHPAVKNRHAIDWVRGVLARFADAHVAAARHPSPSPSRLAVLRPAGDRRRIVNAAPLAARLAAARFAAVDPSRLGFAAQLALFRDAELVVGAMGAAMTGTIVCRPGTSVVHLAAEGWHEYFYADLAGLCGHDHHLVLGPREPGPAPPHRAAFSVPLDALAAVLGHASR